MSDPEWLAQRFEAERTRLRQVAYRMLGSLDEADDAVQEAWLRLSRTDGSAIENLGAWLTTVVGRVCLDMLKARRTRSGAQGSSRLPEPIVTIDGAPGPEEQALIADSIGLALLVVLETLSPDERLAFVLHDTFGLPFDKVAPIVGRSPTAARQLASRARRRVRAAAPTSATDPAGQERLVNAFFAAAQRGDFDALIEMLHPDVVLRSDGGPDSPFTLPPIEGAEAVIHAALAGARSGRPVRPALVNGAPGALIGEPGQPFAVVGFTVSGGRIAELDFIIDPAKLTRIASGNGEDA